MINWGRWGNLQNIINAFQIEIALAVVVLCLLLVLVFFYMEKMYPRIVRVVLLTCSCLALIIIFYKTIFCRSVRTTNLVFTPLWTIPKILTGDIGIMQEALLNFLLYVPIGCFGAALSLRGRKVGLRVIMFGALLSIFVETMQFILKLGSAEIDDILYNTMGAAFGAGCSKVIQKLLSPKSEKGK